MRLSNKVLYTRPHRPVICQTVPPSRESYKPHHFHAFPAHEGGAHTSRVRMASPSRLHKRTVLSHDPEAMVLPSGEKATLVTPSVWPYSGMRGIRHSLVHTPHTERVAGPCAGAPTTVPQHPTAPTGMATPHGGTQWQKRIKSVQK